MDEREILKQFSYKATSNLVLEQDGRRRGRSSDTGEVAALKIGQIPGRMGDKVTAERPPVTSAPSSERSKRTADEAGLASRPDLDVEPSSSRVAGAEKSKTRARDVVDIANELELGAGGMGYLPTTPLSRKAYEGILAFVRAKIGDQPPDVLRSVAEETIATMKDQKLKEMERKTIISDLLEEKLTDDEFSRLSTFGRHIEDFGASGDLADGDATDNALAVIIEDVDEDVENNQDALDEVLDDEDDGDRQLTDLRENAYEEEPEDPIIAENEDERAGISGIEDDLIGMSRDLSSTTAPSLREDTTRDSSSNRRSVKSPEAELDPRSVDRYWIQRKLSLFYSDPHECQKLSESVFDTLADAIDDRTCENELFSLLDFRKDTFEFLKLLLNYRTTIVSCIKLARAQSNEERELLEKEISKTREGQLLLASLSSDIISAAAQEDAGDQTTKKKKTRKRGRHGLLDEKEGKDSSLQARIPGRARGMPRMALRKLDLDDLVFSQGNHLLSAKDVKLPSGSVHLEHKDYEEWHIPAVAAQRTEGERDPVAISSLPSWAQPAFRNTTHLNRLQSAVFSEAFESDNNLLICAPTGAGKTNVAVLTILRTLYNATANEVSMRDFNPEFTDINSFKVVYVAPMKALVAEVVANLGNRLAAFNVTVRELTGDVNLSQKEISETQVIVTTPEKWDVITRKAGERTFTSLVRLLIIDEIHLLHDDRGPVLEAIIARTVRNVDSASVVTRIVGLSATLPNYKDVGAVLRVDPNHGLFFFDSTYRPRPLQQCYVGITARKAVKRFQAMNSITYEKVKSQVVASNQVIVFVHSRKETSSTARYIAEKAIEDESINSFMQHGTGAYEIIQSVVENVDNDSLRNLLPRGIAIHHAGMTRSDRNLVEALFDDGHIKVLVSTSTLAWGVNLPAHAVIIKGTQIYSPEKSRWIELSPLDVMQMMGRAGRPQYDEYGEGFIITTRPEVQFYLSLLNQQLPIESQLISRLVDMLNAEVATGCVTSLAEGAQWLSYTYLFVRMVQNPALYGIPVDEKAADRTLERRRLELVHAAATILHRSKLVNYDRKSGALSSTALGRIASDFYVGYRTMAVYVEHLKPTMVDVDLLRLFSLSGEFQHMRVREEEKLEVQRLSERVPIPVKDSLDEPPAKVNILLQAYISNIKLDGLVLKADMVYITQNAARLTRALLQIALQKRWASLSHKCLVLCKMIANKQWNSQTPLRQFSSVANEAILRKLERKDFEFERYYDLTSAELGEVLRDSKFGRTAYRLIHSLPRLHVDPKVRPLSRSTLEVELTLTPDFRFDSNVHGAGETFWIFVEDSDSENLLHSESFYVRKAVAREQHTLWFTVQVTLPKPPHYFVRCCSDRWIVPDTVHPISFQRLLLPEKFAAHTKFLGLRPLRVVDALSIEGEKPLDVTAFEESLLALRHYYLQRDVHLTSFVTQVLPIVFKSNENTVIACLPGNDRTSCAELAIGRLFCLRPTSVAVWIAGRGDATVEHISKQLQSSIGKALGLEIRTLQGEIATDIGHLKSPGSLVVCSPQNFDAFSRRWKRKRERRVLNGLGLIILDGVHLIGQSEQHGAVLEVVGSRLRYIAKEIASSGKDPYRLLALSDPVANAADMCHWLDSPRESLQSFHPSSLPGCPKVEIRSVIFRAGGGAVSTPPAISRAIYRSIRSLGPESAEPIVVFVPSRKMARSMALELVVMAPGQGFPNGFLQIGKTQLEPYRNRVKVTSLRECISYGVAYLHEGLIKSDQVIAEELFSLGALQIVVTTVEYLAHSAAVSGRLVVVAGTAKEESGGYSLNRAEYSSSDLTAMICCARPNKEDMPGTCVILTEPAMEEYYRRTCLQPAPVESQLSNVLTDQINAEIASRVIETKQDAVDYLTWTLFYRRLPKNPNYYGMNGTSHVDISNHLSFMIESSLSVLESLKCVDAEGDDDMALGALNLGIIASHYYVRHETIELFASLATPRMKIRRLLDILSNAKEFSAIPVRIGDEDAISRLSESMPIRLKQPNDNSAPSLSSLSSKVHLLLQSHLSRTQLAGDLLEDRAMIVETAVKLLRAMVDVISSAGWLEPTLNAMELSQMMVQAVWNTEEPLLQFPHFDEEMVKMLKETYEVSDVDDFANLDPEILKVALSKFSGSQKVEIEKACNAHPSIEDFSIVSASCLLDNSSDHAVVVVEVFIKREYAEDDNTDEEAEKPVLEVPNVAAPRFPKERREGWWIVVGNVKSSTLLTVEHLSLKANADLKLRFPAPDAFGSHDLKLYLMSDSYIGCDLEEDFTIDVPQAHKPEDSGGKNGDINMDVA